MASASAAAAAAAAATTKNSFPNQFCFDAFVDSLCNNGNTLMEFLLSTALPSRLLPFNGLGGAPFALLYLPTYESKIQKLIANVGFKITGKAGVPPWLSRFVCAYHPCHPGFESQAHHLRLL